MTLKSSPSSLFIEESYVPKSAIGIKRTLVSSTFPDKWKLESIIVALLKEGDHVLASNNRPYLWLSENRKYHFPDTINIMVTDF